VDGSVTLTVNFRRKGMSPLTVVGVRKLVFLLRHSEDRVILSSFVWVQYQRVTDRQTDGQTELARLVSCAVARENCAGMICHKPSRMIDRVSCMCVLTSIAVVAMY